MYVHNFIKFKQNILKLIANFIIKQKNMLIFLTKQLKTMENYLMA